MTNSSTTENNRESFTVGHLSDTHLGYEAYRSLSASGNNQRGADIAGAFVSSCTDIVSADPALVIHAGDAIDKPHVPYRYLVVLRSGLQKLAGIRPDGTRRQVVIISGNHDQPHNLKEPAALELLRGLPGIHVVTTKYEVIDFTSKTAENCDEVLKSVAVHAIPHDVLKTVDSKEIQPLEGKTNILTTHGVAGGSELFVRSLGREFAVSTDVLGRNWDYVALGHWHKQGPVGLTATKEEKVGKIWYSGSTENMSFRDLRDNGQKRGWLLVDIKPGETPEVTRRNVPIRAMFRLPHIDATGKTPEEITQMLKDNLKKEEINKAIVGQIVEGVTREVWSLVDMVAVREKAKDAMHYEATAKYAYSEKKEKNGEVGLGDLGRILEEQTGILLTPLERTPALELAKKLLGSALTVVNIEDAEETGKGSKEESAGTKSGASKSAAQSTGEESAQEDVTEKDVTEKAFIAEDTTA